MAGKRDYYDVLGISRGANDQDVKKAFRRLARQYHPDVSDEPDAEERFKEINEAYAILSDPQKRAAYDRYGHAAFGNGAPGGAYPYADISDIFEEIFGSAFGGAATRTRRGPRQGKDILKRLRIDFEEAVVGTEREITFNRHAACSVCNGSGAEPGTSPQTCPTCQGSGEVRRLRQGILSMVTIEPCPTCSGRGQVIEDPCHNCRGQGRVREEQVLRVSIPPGISDGAQIRITGEGELGVNGGPRGNLYIALTVKPHDYFRRKGDDLLVTIPVNIAQATLGAEVMVPTLTEQGELEMPLDVPSGTQSGDVLTLPGRGVPRKRGGAGDLRVMVEVEIPKRLTSEQRDLFEQLAETMGTEVKPRSNQRSFFDRVIDWLGGE
ncbi:MAG: molecular chaperone DnaJ [Anaerolineae bacterium]